MPDPRDFLPTPPWKGPPVPRLTKWRSKWVDRAYLEAEEFADCPLREWLDDTRDITTSLQREKFKTIVGGYYLIATGRASGEIVDDTFRATSSFWDYYLEFFRKIHKERGLTYPSRQALVEALEEDNLGVKAADSLIRLARMEPTRANKVIAIDAVLHVQHETGSPLTVWVGEDLSLAIVDLLDKLGEVK